MRQRSGAIAKRLRHTVVRLVAAIGSANDAPRRGRSAVARQVHLQLRVTVAAVLEAKRLELVVARRKHHRVRLKVAPGVARGVLRAVDADEGAEAVVGVHAEGVGARADLIHAEWDADVEADVGPRAAHADVLVAQEGGRRYRAVAVSCRFRLNLGARSELGQRRAVRAVSARRVVVALSGVEVNAPEYDGQVLVGEALVLSAHTAHGAAKFASLAGEYGRHELRRGLRVHADGALVDRVRAAHVAPLDALRVGRVRVGAHGALENVPLVSSASPEPCRHGQRCQPCRGAVCVDLPKLVTELATENARHVVVIPVPVTAHGAPATGAVVDARVEDLHAALPALAGHRVRAAEARSG